ncbi:MAG: hypothetical protein HY319_22980 [Armatimonadetes bacterium]|nr:hypothetical protein [Armatimonadota bacterium]
MAAVAVHTTPSPVGKHSGDELGDLYREMRSHDPAAWRRAAHQLGRQAAVGGLAFTILRGLLTSPSSELKLRGVVALNGVAPWLPDQVVDFLRDRLAETTVWQDPVLLEAVMEVAASLEQAAGTFVAHCLAHPQPAVRAAACSVLARRADTPWELVQQMASDPSLEVRAALAVAMLEEPHHPARQKALSTLSQSPEPEMRLLLGDLQPTVRTFPTRAPLPRGRATLEQLEAQLDREPGAALDLLRELLQGSSPRPLMEKLGAIARNRSVAALCRAIAALLDSESRETDRLLRVVGILHPVAAAEPIRDFYFLSSLCLSAVEVEDMSDMAAWSERRKLDGVVRSLWAPARRQPGAAEKALDMLSSLHQDLGDRSLHKLSEVRERLGHGLDELASGCESPESLLLLPVYRRWIEVIDGEVLGVEDLQ